MFSFFSRPKAPNSTTSTIVFDEAYCHSAGPGSGSKTYEIKQGTTELIFAFEKFDEFIATYLFNNPYLPEAIKNTVREKTGSFCAQVVQGGLYLCTEGISAEGTIVFRAQSLTPLNSQKRLREFSRGAIGFGIFQPNASAFHVLWATMHGATKREPTVEQVRRS